MITQAMAEARVEFLERAFEGLTMWLAYVVREALDTAALAGRDIAVAVTPCQFLGKRRFEFGRAGDPLAAVIEVIGADCVSVDDLCAWPIQHPERFATLFGRGAVLGADALCTPATWFAGATLRAWETPLQWLKAKCVGCVLLDHRQGFACEAFARVRGGRASIIGEDAAHGWALMKASGLPRETFGYDDGT